MPSGWTRKRQHLDLVHRGRARPEHRPAPPSLQGRLSDQEGSPRRPPAGPGGPTVGNLRGAVQADDPQLPAGGVAPGEPAAPAAALFVRQLHDLHQDPCRAEARGHRTAAAHPSNLSAFYRAFSPTPGATARAWPPRRCATSTPCCTGPSRTPSASATWSATWPTPSPTAGASPEMQVWTRAAARLPGPRSPRSPVRPVAAGRHHRDAAGRARRAPLGRRRPDAARLSPGGPGWWSTTWSMSPSPRPGWASVAGPGPGTPWPPCRSTRLGRSRNAPTSGRPGWIRGWCSPGRTAPPSTRTSSPTGSDGWPAPPACRRSGCMTSATATPPPRAAGVPAKVVSERLGHATIAITLDVYSHVIPGMDAQAANVWPA